MYNIRTKNLGEAWFESMKLVLSSGQDFYDGDINLKEIRNLYVSIEDIDEHDEILEKYADRSRIELMKKKYFTCGLVGDYKIDYGSYIFNNNGVNQFEWLYERLKNKPETKSATIVMHIPGEENLTCLSMLDFKLRDDKLYMTAVYRSQNIYASQPGNLVALRNLQKALAEKLEVNVGGVELAVMSAHIYENNYDAAKKIVEELS